VHVVTITGNDGALGLRTVLRVTTRLPGASVTDERCAR
jgi:hypothetical protein